LQGRLQDKHKGCRTSIKAAGKAGLVGGRIEQAAGQAG